MRHKHLRRLNLLWMSNPVYFVTVCTHSRNNILASDEACNVLVGEWATAKIRHGWVIGRYVIMPNHVHFFCCPLPDGAKPVAAGVDRGSLARSLPLDSSLTSTRSATAVKVKPLARFVGLWKEWTSKGLTHILGIPAPIWQREFFDHVLRSRESYGEKWEYVRQNPVRAGLVTHAENWKYQGFVDFDTPL